MGKTLLTGKQQEELYVFVLFIFSLTCRENQLFFFKDTVRFWTICKTLGSMKQQQPLRRKQRLPTRMTRRSLQDCWRRNGLQWSDCRRRFASSLSSFSFSIVVVLCFVLVRPRGITGCLLDLRLKFFLFVVACLFIFSYPGDGFGEADNGVARGGEQCSLTEAHQLSWLDSQVRKKRRSQTQTRRRQLSL